MENSIDKKYIEAENGIEKLIAITNLMKAAGYDTDHQSLQEALEMVNAFETLMLDLYTKQIII